MRRIPADFNRLGMVAPNEIPLASVGWPSYAPYNLHEGEPVIADDIILEARSVIKIADYDGKPWWVVVIDPATMRDIEPSKSSRAPTPTTPKG